MEYKYRLIGNSQGDVKTFLDVLQNIYRDSELDSIPIREAILGYYKNLNEVDKDGMV